jgi:hypothetical protein
MYASHLELTPLERGEYRSTASGKQYSQSHIARAVRRVSRDPERSPPRLLHFAQFRPAAINAGCEHPHVCQRAYQRLARSGASALVPRLLDADLREVK